MMPIFTIIFPEAQKCAILVSVFEPVTIELLSLEMMQYIWNLKQSYELLMIAYISPNLV